MLPATERLTELFNKQLEGSLTPAERQELAAYAMQNGLQPALQQLIEDAWSKTGAEEDVLPEKAAEIQAFILQEENRQAITRRLPAGKWWWAAAGVLLLFTSGLLYHQWYGKSDGAVAVVKPVEDIRPGSEGAVLTLSDGRRFTLDSVSNSIVSGKNGVEAEIKNGQLEYKAAGTAAEQPELYTVTTARGKQFQLQLPDGSKVWLNTASSITYPSAFHGNFRKVSVTGETYFEVNTLSAVHPFEVACNGQTVTVLGTRFNIDSYKDDGVVKTTLRDGKVRVTTGAGGETRVLRPSQQSLVAENGAIEVKEVNVEEVIAWQMGYFSFTNTPFAQMMRQLARWYDIEVKYEGKVPQTEFEGRLNQSVNLSRVLDFFKESGVKFRLENHTLIIQ